MKLQVYDFRRDIKQMFVTPHIRCRFMTMEPGETGGFHSHDLGHEIFLILQGRARFHIAGEEAMLEAGQLCIARADEPHYVEVVGDEQMIMYLSVTPHVVPTHTPLDDDGKRLPWDFAAPEAYGSNSRQESSSELLDRLVEAADDLASVAQTAAVRQRRGARELKAALATGESDNMQLREAMWQGLFETYKQLDILSDLWNDVAPRLAPREST